MSSTPSQGSARGGGTNSASGLLWTVVPSVVVAAVLTSLVVFLQKKYRNIYLPRTYLAVFRDTQRTVWGGWKRFFKMPDITALHHNGLDAYLFLRFWRLAILICLFSWPITWIILMPVYGTAHGDQTQFDKISFSNIESNEDGNRLYAVSFVSMIVLIGFMLMIFRERLYTAKLVLSYNHAKLHSSQLSSRTILLTDMSDNSPAGEHGFDGAVHTWPAAAAKDLQDLYEDRIKATNKLEKALVKWALKAPAEDGMHRSVTTESSDKDVERHNAGDRKYRPTTRFASFKLIGRKVDVIDYQSEELAKIRRKIESKQAEYNGMESKTAPAQFVEFKTQAAALQAYKYHDNRLSKNCRSRAIGSAPDDIIWKNLEMSKAQRSARRAIVIVIICIMILFWGPITAVIGAITNINYLTNEVPFLGFINSIPDVILGVVTGLLPALLLSLLLVLVPAIMRFMFKMAGAVTCSEAELRTQRWYFIFQVIQVFLITTLASGASAVATTIVQNPPAAVNILASNLPKASNFYIAYLILQGVAIPAKQVLNPFKLIMVFVGKITDKTPRAKYTRYTSTQAFQWGKMYPKYTTFVVIAISYSCIAPLILGFAALAFVFLYTASRYDMFYSIDTTFLDTHGQAYTKALQQMTTGIYLAELCLIGLMAINSANNVYGVGPLVLNIVLLIFTVVLHLAFNGSITLIKHKSSDLVTEYASQTEHRTSEDSGPSFSRALNEVFSSNNSNVKGAGKAQNFTTTFTMKMHKFLRVPTIDLQPSYFSSEARELSQEEYKEMYVHPAAQDFGPLWLPADQSGKTPAGFASVVDSHDLTTRGSWIQDGKVHVEWREAASDAQEAESIRKAPIWDDVRRY